MNPNIESQQLSAQAIQETVPPVPSKSPKSFWFKWALIAVAVVFLLSGTTYFFMNQSKQNQQPPQVTQTTPTPDPTADWKTYTNTKYNYQIIYPPNWQLEEYQVTNNEGVSLYPPEVDLAEAIKDPSKMILASAPDIGISVRSIPLSSYPQGNENQGGVDFITDWKVVNINGVNGIYYKQHQCAPQCSAITVLPLDRQKTINISISDVAQDQGYVSVYNQILSTFKFTNQNLTNSASICASESSSIKSLIDTFETLQMKRDAKGVLELFTPPINSDDIDNYNFFIGKNTGVAGLYGNVTTNINVPSYKMIDEPTENPNGCVIQIEEQRSVWSNAGASIGYQPPQPYLATVEVIKGNNIWKIDKYYSAGSTAKKYGAWGY